MHCNKKPSCYRKHTKALLKDYALHNAENYEHNEEQDPEIFSFVVEAFK